MPYASPAQRSAVWAKRNRDEKLKKLDPYRWDQVVIKTTEGPDLTKRDVFNYYTDPTIRKKIVEQLKDRPVLAVQTFNPDRSVYRRNHSADKPIAISSASRDAQDATDLGWYAERRFTEFHPVIEKKTDEVWVDIDPGESHTPDTVKPIVKAVNAVVENVPGVKNTQVAYSGGRGYYVKGELDSSASTDAMRKALSKHLKPVIQSYAEATMDTPSKDQVRLDISTLHDKGSIRALYSLNKDTGRVSVPVAIEALDNFDAAKDADPRTFIKKQYKPQREISEFAPGIPATRKTEVIPNVQGKHWTMSVQEHLANKAGKHWDLRLVDPHTAHAHSWAIPKARFPSEGGRPLLAIQTPTHTARYALTFGEGKPQTIGKGYGKGSVEIKHKEPIRVLSANENKITFQRELGEKYYLFRTKNDAWLLRNARTTEKKGSSMTPFEYGYHDILVKLGNANAPVPTPMEATDEGLPVSMLTRALNELPPTPERRDDKSKGTARVEGRLNSAVSWDSGMEVSPSMTVGPSPILGQW